MCENKEIRYSVSELTDKLLDEIDGYTDGNKTISSERVLNILWNQFKLNHFLKGKEFDYIPSGDINVGDVVYVNYFIGAGTEIINGHWSYVVKKDMDENMIFVIPMTSVSVDQLGVPLRKSEQYVDVRFDKTPIKSIAKLHYSQARSIHCSRVNLIKGKGTLIKSHAEIVDKLQETIIGG